VSALRLVACVLAASLGGTLGVRAARAEAEAGLASLLERQAPISAPEPGLVRLVLPPEVIKACRPDLSDLRVFDRAEREVAFLVDSLRLDEALEITERADAEVVGVRREVVEPERGPGATREVYEIAVPPLPPRAGTWDLVFESAQARFVREVTISQAAPGGDEILAGAEPLFRLDDATRRLRLRLPPLGQGALRVEIRGSEGSFLEPHVHFESGRRIEAAERGGVLLEEIARERGEGRTVIELVRPRGLVPAWLRVETRTGTLRRPISVYDEQQGSADVRLGGATLYRLAGGTESLLVYLRPARGATLRVEIEDGDSPALEELRFHAVIRRPALVFELPADAEGSGVSGTLRFGGGRVRRALYDLDSFRPRDGQTGGHAEAAARLAEGSWLPLASLGEIQPNPRFDATPALAFAMHPGAEVDPRIFSHRRSVALAPSPEGLSRLALSAEDAALLRADLADLRVVDGEGRQWPYLWSAGARRTGVPLQVGKQRPERRRSRYALGLPAAPLRVESVALRSEVPYFDRSYELLARDAEGRVHTAARGRLVKQPLRPRPVEIALSGQPVHGLDLVVDDGDDAPLELAGGTAQLLLPELFLVAPAGRYELLLGNPDVPAPRYELERVRGVVLAASSHAAEPGALEENPVYSLRARLGSEGGASGLLQTGLVWGALLLAVAVLGALTLRLVRQAPPPGDPGGSSGER
jgi:hypothetical protein